MACGGGRRLGEGERCKRPLEESLRAAAAFADRGPKGAPKNTPHSRALGPIVSHAISQSK
ncbi:hypothetical protein FQA47_023205 [Oryzias melastigma]|uniref:Uncharacterized protein n=1 Tax=Oryzias melastigma TaxID=30732 RepID=A0A834CX57_ORYME|nr:hypothetical protein FQA47_023205 [Oryzias melastigma]